MEERKWKENGTTDHRKIKALCKTVSVLARAIIFQSHWRELISFAHGMFLPDFHASVGGFGC